jgi:hypothetical protein
VIRKPKDIIKNLGEAASLFEMDEAAGRGLTALLRKAIFDRQARKHNIFHQCRCTINQLKRPNHPASIVLSPCNVPDTMTAAYICNAVFGCKDQDLAATYSLEYANEVACVLTLMVQLRKTTEIRLVLSVPLDCAQEFAAAGLSSTTAGESHAQPLRKLYDPGACAKCAAKQVEGLKTCGKCGIARYCSKECQRADWPQHKTHCVARIAGGSAIGPSRPSVLFVEKPKTKRDKEAMFKRMNLSEDDVLILDMD